MPTWRLQTSPPSPAAAPGAIAIVQIIGAAPEIDEVAERLALAPLPVGAAALRNLLNIDRALVARFAPTSITLFPHGSAAVIRALARALTEAGIPEAPAGDQDPRALYPEATTDIEARMLAALARAPSPLAIDLLLDQPRRWAHHAMNAPPRSTVPPANIIAADSLLRHLLTPPLVIAIGPPNIGKSSLLNALAGRSIALVADEAGTTRDHIGMQIDMAGLIVRYIDTPGMRQPAAAIEAEAIQLAAALLRSADLILNCGDITAPPLPPPPSPAPTITVATRADLGIPSWPHDIAISAHTGQHLQRLVAIVRDQLVPPALLADHRPWRFF